MDQGKFDGLALRLALAPKLTRSEMARKMDVSWSYLRQLEDGRMKWPVFRREEFVKLCEQWAASPWAIQRKVRKDTGKKHRRRKRRKMAVMGTPDKIVSDCPRQEPELVPVPHSHGEVVGIG